MIRGTGCLLNDYDDRDYDYPVTALLEFKGLPQIVDHRYYLNRSGFKPHDQLRTNSCVGWAVSSGIYLRAKILGWDVEFGSPLAAYALGRAKAAGSSTQPLTDVGSQPRLVMKALQEHGVCPERLWPFDPSKVNDRPEWSALAESANHKLESYHWIMSDGSVRWNEICAALAEGYPVTMAVAADDRLRRCRSWDPIDDVDEESIKGLHYMTAVGYDLDSLIMLNSWGEEWGEGGYCRLSYERVVSPSTTMIGVVETAPI